MNGFGVILNEECMWHLPFNQSVMVVNLDVTFELVQLEIPY